MGVSLWKLFYDEKENNIQKSLQTLAILFKLGLRVFSLNSAFHLQLDKFSSSRYFMERLTLNEI